MSNKQIKEIHYLLSSGTNELSCMMNEMNKSERIARLLVDNKSREDPLTLAFFAEELCGERIAWRLEGQKLNPLDIPDYAVFFWRCQIVVSLGRNKTMENERRIFMPGLNGSTVASEINIEDQKFIYVRPASTTIILSIAEKHGKKIKELIKRGPIR